ncbi:beta-phosphoglucomutase [Leptothermofonsia sp. ETS-13]|uniref:beta-phosphoglucomutase n=1 Tax=Leptothermofonsia sp. ETS-13 TaxID=3035696 RepID=UPI003BA17C0C
MQQADWIVTETTEDSFNPTQQHHKETVFTLSNGYLGTRGSFEEGYPGDRPSTLIHGVYDNVPTVFTELANAPNWLSLSIIVGGICFRLDQGRVLAYKRWLDMQHGLLSRYVRWQSPAGYTFEFRFDRFASLADEHVLALQCQITSIDYAGPIEVHTSLNGYSDNQGYMHWDAVNQGGKDHSVWLHIRTRYTKIDLGMAARLAISGVATEQTTPISFQGYPTLVTQFSIQPEQTAYLEKIVTVYTSRDVPDPVLMAQDKLANLPDFHSLYADHEAAWAKVWEISDIVIEGDLNAQLAVRYNLFQLLSVAPRNDSRVSIPAKTLSGFAYRGHIFWDTEIFILPCLTYTQPELARNLLTYRYHTLEGARRKAKAHGYEGAMYVWESANTGDEVTPSWVPTPSGENLVRIWCGEIELHISTDVAYASWHYWQATGDHAWMRDCGAEMILDTAVFWGSRVEWNSDRHCYEINDVIGPDEYHERVNNNAFTNIMMRWHLRTALKVWDWLQKTDREWADELQQRLNLTSDRLQHWEDIIQKIWISQDATGLIEQFEGFFNLEDLNLDDYEPRTRSMQAILGIEGANSRQVLKQPDVVMLLYLLRQGIFTQPHEDSYSRETLQTNWDYYVPRTDHTYGSSLGPAVHAIMACELDKPAEAYEHFMRAALVDLSDVRGNAHEGIHAASTGGTWQAVVFGFAGIHLTENGPVATPRLPESWTRLKFQFVWQGQVYKFDLRKSQTSSRKLEDTELAFSPPRIFPSAVPSSDRVDKLIQPLQPLSLRGVIFDLDGVLTDTSEFHYLAWKRLADEEGVPFNRTANEALRGVSRRDSLLFLLNGRPATEEQLQEMMARKNGYYLDFIRTITPRHLLPGVSELLDELRAGGIKVAVGSASKNAREVIERLGITNRIDAIADGLSVIHSKPAPDVFLHAAELLHLNPAYCVVVEDAESGIEAALQARMWAIGLGPADRVGAAHVVLPNLQGVHWADLQDKLTTIARTIPESSSALQMMTLQNWQTTRG